MSVGILSLIVRVGDLAGFGLSGVGMVIGVDDGGDLMDGSILLPLLQPETIAIIETIIIMIINKRA
jgi:hypothetical protein